MANQTKKWWCDTCNEPITKIEDGWVEWVSLSDDKTLRGLRLVHHLPASPQKPRGCQYSSQAEYKRDGGILADLPLKNFLGPDGLMTLLTLLLRGLPKDDFIAMAQRLHLPGYERARFHAVDALNAGVIDTNLPPGFYRQSTIEAVLEWADENKLVP